MQYDSKYNIHKSYTVTSSLPIAPLVYTSATNESLPTKTCACLTPLSTAGVSEKIVSVATDSCLLGTFNAQFLLFKCSFHRKRIQGYSPLCSLINHLFDNIRIDQSKLWSHFVIINWCLMKCICLFTNRL